jgi:hypothetical protein
MKEIVVNKKRGTITLIDDLDADIFRQFATTGTTPFGYVFLRKTGVKGKYSYLHRIIAGRILGRELTRKEVVDHIDCNPLNNLRENLRVCTQGQNILNQVKRYNSKHKGYSFDPTRKKWVVQVGYQGKNYQKRFKTEAEADAYATHLRNILHGEFANHG